MGNCFAKKSTDGRRRKSFAERRETIRLQVERMYKEVKDKYRARMITLGVLCILLLLALLGLILYKYERDKDYCRTDECEEIAKEIHENLNLDVDPCEDFYDYACGGWINKNPRPFNKKRWGKFTKVREEVINKALDAFEDSSSFKKSEALQKARNLYKACINTATRDQSGIYELRRALNSINFPMTIPEWDNRSFDLLRVLLYSNLKLSVEPFIKISVFSNKDTNHTTNAIHIRRPRFAFGEALLNKSSTREEKLKLEESFITNITKYTRLLETRVAQQKLNADLEELIQFEVELAKATKIQETKNKTSRNVYGSTTLREMDSKYKIKWSDLIVETFKSVDISLSLDETIKVEDEYYMDELDRILRQTKNNTIANFIGVRIIQSVGKATILEMKEPNPDFSLRRECYEETELFFSLALNHIFVKKYFDNNSLKQLNDFVKHLKVSLTLIIQNSEWIDDDTKMNAQLKLNKMLSYMAAPDWIKNERELDDYYAETEYISPENYFNGRKLVIIWLKRKQLLTLRNTEKEPYVFGPSTVNAYYIPHKNNIAITSGILHPPFYYSFGPIVLNFGGIGSIIGHEITHGFDDDGKNFDHKGKERDWWTNSSRTLYKEKVDCFKKQYSELVEPLTNIKVNGSLTVGDNIADNGGVNQAYKAYKIYTATKDNSMDLKLPSPMDKFSKGQLFFISYANMWCSNNAKEDRLEMIKYDPHAPERFRVLVPLRNSHEFSKEFNCKPGSKMNPDKKCILW